MIQKDPEILKDPWKFPLSRERRKILDAFRERKRFSTSEFEQWCDENHMRKSTDRRRRNLQEMGFLFTRLMTLEERILHHVAENSHAGWIYEYVEGSFEEYQERLKAKGGQSRRPVLSGRIDPPDSFEGGVLSRLIGEPQGPQVEKLPQEQNGQLKFA